MYSCAYMEQCKLNRADWISIHQKAGRKDISHLDYHGQTASEQVADTICTAFLCATQNFHFFMSLLAQACWYCLLFSEEFYNMIFVTERILSFLYVCFILVSFCNYRITSECCSSIVF